MCSCSSRHCGLSVRRLANMLILYDCLSTFSFFSKLGFRSDDFATVQMYHFFDAVTGKRPYFQTLPDNCLWRNFQIKSMISIHTLDFNYQYICLWKLKLVVVTAPWNLSHPKKKKRKRKTFHWTCFLTRYLLTWSHDLQQKLAKDFLVLQLQKKREKLMG